MVTLEDKIRKQINAGFQMDYNWEDKLVNVFQTEEVVENIMIDFNIEMVELLRFALFGGTPELYDGGGLLGNINITPNHTYNRAKKVLDDYILARLK